MTEQDVPILTPDGDLMPVPTPGDDIQPTNEPDVAQAIFDSDPLPAAKMHAMLDLVDDRHRKNPGPIDDQIKMDGYGILEHHHVRVIETREKIAAKREQLEKELDGGELAVASAKVVGGGMKAFATQYDERINDGQKYLDGFREQVSVDPEVVDVLQVFKLLINDGQPEDAFAFFSAFKDHPSAGPYVFSLFKSVQRRPPRKWKGLEKAIGVVIGKGSKNNFLARFAAAEKFERKGRKRMRDQLVRAGNELI